MTPTDFGSRIASLRNEKKLTQTELAEKLNVSTQAVSKWETGAGFPDVQTIPGIARILETTTDYLFGCVKKQQKVMVFNVLEGDGVSTGRNYRRKYEAELNDNYLLHGWKVVQSHLSSTEEMTYMMVVIERDD
ncbi:MAG: helix-turn-helix transcriptional regulator [Clostridia bacterium]|nr:helix-turn-helix transcriptional regulator [Clostridia bacterium]